MNKLDLSKYFDQSPEAASHANLDDASKFKKDVLKSLISKSSDYIKKLQEIHVDDYYQNGGKVLDKIRRTKKAFDEKFYRFKEIGKSVCTLGLYNLKNKIGDMLGTKASKDRQSRRAQYELHKAEENMREIINIEHYKKVAQIVKMITELKKADKNHDYFNTENMQLMSYNKLTYIKSKMKEVDANKLDPDSKAVYDDIAKKLTLFDKSEEIGKDISKMKKDELNKIFKLYSGCINNNNNLDNKTKRALRELFISNKDKFFQSITVDADGNMKNSIKAGTLFQKFDLQINNSGVDVTGIVNGLLQIGMSKEDIAKNLNNIGFKDQTGNKLKAEIFNQP